MAGLFFKKADPAQKKPDNLIPLQGDLLSKRVWSKSLNKFGLVLKVKGHKLYVDFSGLKSWVDKSDLFLDSQNLPKNASISVHYNKTSNASTRLDARGTRLEAFQKLVYDSLVELLNGDIPYLDIIHGHGEGILKKWIREHLKSSSDYEWTPQDGNDGVTRVSLKR